MNRDNILESFSVTELEDRVEFGLCGGGDGDGDGGGGDDDGGNSGCNPLVHDCEEK